MRGSEYREPKLCEPVLGALNLRELKNINLNEEKFT